MITGIEIENFKAVGSRIKIDVKPITLLFGPNGAGKSSVIQALQYANEVLSRGNLNPDSTGPGGTVVDLGGFRSLVHRRDLSRRVSIGFSLAGEGNADREYRLGSIRLSPQRDHTIEAQIQDHFEPVREFISGRLGTAAHMELGLAWDQALGAPVLDRLTSRRKPGGEVSLSLDGDGSEARAVFDTEAMAALFCSPDFPHYIEVGSHLNADAFRRLGGLQPRVSRQLGAAPDLSRSLELRGEELERWFFEAATERGLEDWGPGEGLVGYLEGINYYADRLLSPIRAAGSWLREMCYLGPLRRVPGRGFLPSRTPNPARWADGLAAWDLLHTKSLSLLEQASEWMSRPDCLNTGYALEAIETYGVPIDDALRDLISKAREGDADAARGLGDMLDGSSVGRQIKILDRSLGVTMDPMDIGLGISQVLPVVVAALDGDSRLVCIEEPEGHVHPAVQVGLGDLFATQASSEERTFIIETHSEHLLLRLLRRIRETAGGELPEGAPALTPDDVSVVFMEKVGGEVKATQLRVDEEGEFVDRWPRGFFAERALELF